MKDNLCVFSFWAIDDMTDNYVLKNQLDTIKSCGFNGVVFHPRRYSGNPEYLGDEYMQILSELILYAKSINMDFWLYDENGWPSGSADGKVEKAMPELSCKWLEYNNGKVDIKERKGINSLSKAGVQKFIEITHETYKNKLSKEAFDYVGGFFSDEVGFLEGHGACADRCGIPWSDELEDKYRLEFGDNIYLKLPLLFCETADSFKSWYWERLTELLANNFYAQINDWCKANDKLYTAHLKGEEHPFFSIGYNGSCFGVLKNVAVPGVDALERYCGNNYFPRIASSLAKQFGCGIAMAEAMGGAGWGLEPSDVEKYGEWLVDCGINMIIFHINQLHMTYAGITDWPSSIPCHQPWRGAFQQIIVNLREKANKKSDVLFITPVRGIMEKFAPQLVEGMNEHDGDNPAVCDASAMSLQVINDCSLLCLAGVGFDVTDEKIFEENAIVTDEGVRLGNACYRDIIVSDGCVFNGSVLKQAQNVNEFISGKSLKLRSEKNIRIEIPEQSRWTISYPDENRCPIPINNGEGVFDTKYISDFILLISDKAKDVMINGKELVKIKTDDYGEYYTVPRKVLKYGSNNVVCRGIHRAFAYIIGDFAVYNKTPYYEFDKRQLSCIADFYISERLNDCVDFIKSGYSFSDKPIVCKKMIKGISGKVVYIDCTHIAAAHVFINGNDYGWVYKNRELIDVGEVNDAEVLCEIYQSAYNIYGPNCYIKGDNPIISPAQYSGEKNFADDSFAPENTSDGTFKLIKWAIDENVVTFDDKI